MDQPIPKVLKFIEIVDKFFPAPRFKGSDTDEAIWVRTLSRLLGGYDEGVLMEAAEEIVRTRDPAKDGTMFPKPAEITRACEAVAEARRLREVPLLETETAIRRREREMLAWSKDRLALAEDLCRGELGRRAVREGWIGALFSFCRVNGRLPTTRAEIDEVIGNHRNFVAALDHLEQMDGAIAKSLLALGNSVLARGREIGRRIEEAAR